MGPVCAARGGSAAVFGLRPATKKTIGPMNWTKQIRIHTIRGALSCSLGVRATVISQASSSPSWTVPSTTMITNCVVVSSGIVPRFEVGAPAPLQGRADRKVAEQQHVCQGGQRCAEDDQLSLGMHS